MSKAGLDNRHRNCLDGEIGVELGNNLVGAVSKIYRLGYATGYTRDRKAERGFAAAQQDSR